MQGWRSILMVSVIVDWVNYINNIIVNKIMVDNERMNFDCENYIFCYIIYVQ